MPIDASIPLSAIGRGPTVDPFQVAQSLASMRTQRESAAALREQRESMAEKRRLESEAIRQAQTQAAALRGLQTWTPETVYPIVGPEKGAEILKGLSALQEQELKTEGQVRAMLGAVIGGLKALPEPMREEAYGQVVQALGARGILDPSKVEPYSPEVLDMYQQQAMSPTEQTTNARAEATQAAVLPGQQAESAQKMRGNAAAALAAAPTKEAYAAVFDGRAPELKRVFPPPVAFNPTTTPAIVQRLGMSAEQQSSATAMAARDAEAARHNRVGEFETGRHNRANEATAARATEPLEAVIKDGKSVLVPRSQAVGLTPATNRERTTEDERKSVGWYQQMRDAAATIDALEDKLSERELFQIQTLPHEALIGMANRNQLSENAKRYFRAFTQFSEARLRSVSGAAISAGEYQSDRQTYGKQYGETTQLAADRKRAREVVMESTRQRAGVAMPKDAAPPPAANTPQEGAEAPIPGIPGGVAKFTGGKWIRVK